MKIAWGLVLGAACAGVIACGAAPQKSAAPATGVPSEAAPMPAGSPRDQIAALDQQIDRDLAQLSLARPPVITGPDTIVGGEPTTMGTQPHAAEPTCQPAKTETCTDTCRLADSICANAGSICRIASGDLGGTDGYANERCQSGSASCQAAKQRCCGCT